MRAVTIWLDEELAAALSRFVEDAGGSVSEAEALQAAFRDWALTSGFLDEESATLAEPLVPSTSVVRRLSCVAENSSAIRRRS